MKQCLILGGGGYIGSNWAKRLSARGRFEQIILADVRPSPQIPAGCEFVKCDVREPLAFPDLKPEWIFNFAAVHREPGHAREEYFDTNLAGARNVCDFAERTGCKKILFTSSIAVYGVVDQPKTEQFHTYPSSPYGISKLCAELIHEGWRSRGVDRRLYICRPGVIYGPGDPGNILRMIRAVRKGYFVFPGSRQLRKSYGYIEGLLDSFEFVMSRDEPQLTYNYVERETETLGTLVSMVQAHLGKANWTLVAPLPVLVAGATLVQWFSRGRSPIHPVRVRKTASSTHVVPETLLKMGFPFNYDFAASLKDWKAKAPADFL
jgi:nucleoside-diphosphate-sugar epimerase